MNFSGRMKFQILCVCSFYPPLSELFLADTPVIPDSDGPLLMSKGLWGVGRIREGFTTGRYLFSLYIYRVPVPSLDPEDGNRPLRYSCFLDSPI